MRMTIEEAIRRIDEHNYIHQHKEPRAVYITEAFDVAINIMRKYQKIEQIISNFDESSNYFQTLEQIAKVIDHE